MKFFFFPRNPTLSNPWSSVFLQFYSQLHRHKLLRKGKMNLTSSYAANVLVLVTQYGTMWGTMWDWQGKWILNRKITILLFSFSLSFQPHRSFPAHQLWFLPRVLCICNSLCLDCPSNKCPPSYLALTSFRYSLQSLPHWSLPLSLSQNYQPLFLKMIFFLSIYAYLTYHVFM